MKSFPANWLVSGKVPSSYRSLGSIGYIVPPRCNETVLEEAFRIRPEGVSWCVASLAMPEFGGTHFDEALARVEESADQLAQRGVDVIVYNGMPLTSQRGAGYHSELRNRIQGIVGVSIPVQTDSALVLGALGALNVQRPNLITPYSDETVTKLVGVLEAHGFEVPAATGRGLSLGQIISECDDDWALQDALGSLKPATDSFYISCPQWPVVGSIAEIERVTGLPVVCQLQSILWWALEVMGLGETKKLRGGLPLDLGSLMSADVPSELLP